VLLFLGRLHPQKSCDVAIRAFARIAHRSPGLHLVMAGPDPVGWRAELEALATALGIARQITWTGPVFGDTKWSLFKVCELFVLPSHCEALPYALLEGLACGIPALITTKVNSYREIQNYNCALIGEDTLEDTVKSLRQWLEMPEATKAEMRANARRCFVSEFDSKVAARRLLDYFAQNL
jgi:glycosyltransferase involved in cell wall biosynthesis